jgi:hypothetical protein
VIIAFESHLSVLTNGSKVALGLIVKWMRHPLACLEQNRHPSRCVVYPTSRPFSTSATAPGSAGGFWLPKQRPVL